MKLVDVYDVPNATDVLYALLKQREGRVNISHKKMPSFDEHEKFVASKPYKEWFFIVNKTTGIIGGSVYLTWQNEIGVFVFTGERRKGYGSFAIQSMIIRHPGERLLANIAPENYESQELFKGFGFKLCQFTLEHMPELEQTIQ